MKLFMISTFICGMAHGLTAEESCARSSNLLVIFTKGKHLRQRRKKLRERLGTLTSRYKIQKLVEQDFIDVITSNSNRDI